MTKVKPLLLCILITVMLFSTSYPAHAHQTNAPILIPEIPETIFAAGDIAKCDGDDPWSEELLELVGLLPESAGEERERNEPFLKELLEILHLREETDN